LWQKSKKNYPGHIDGETRVFSWARNDQKAFRGSDGVACRPGKKFLKELRVINDKVPGLGDKKFPKYVVLANHRVSFFLEQNPKFL
jgi:hypothetical protein